MSADGFLLGICNGVDPRVDEGLYASTEAIYRLLEGMEQNDHPDNEGPTMSTEPVARQRLGEQSFSRTTAVHTTAQPMGFYAQLAQEHRSQQPNRSLPRVKSSSTNSIVPTVDDALPGIPR